MGGEDGCDGSLGTYSNCLVDTDDGKQKNKNLTISPEKKTKKSLFFYVIFVQYTKFWLEFGLHKYLDKLWIHLVKESVHLTVSLGISKITTSIDNLMHVENWETDHLQHDL